MMRITHIQDTTLNKVMAQGIKESILWRRCWHSKDQSQKSHRARTHWVCWNRQWSRAPSLRMFAALALVRMAVPSSPTFAGAWPPKGRRAFWSVARRKWDAPRQHLPLHQTLAAPAPGLLQDWSAEQIQRWEVEKLAAEAEAEQRLEEYFVDFPEKRGQLRLSQIEAVRFSLARRGRCLVADEMGLGKSLVALVIAQQFAEQWPLLIIAPASVVTNWKSEIDKWLPHLAQEVQVLQTGKVLVDKKKLIFIISYNLLVDNPHFHRTATGEPYQVIISDEAHVLKTPASKRTQVLLPMLQQAQSCTLLTGTPVLNCAAEVWSLLAALEPGIPSFEHFCARYSESKVVDGEVRLYGGKFEEELHDLLQVYMLRRRKKEVLPELPGKRRIWHKIQASDLNRTHGNRIMSLRRREGCAQYAQMVFGITARAKAKQVCDYVLHLLQDSEKLVVFAHHHSMFDAIQLRLRKQSAGSMWKWVRIDGKVPPALRGALIQRFQEEDDVRVALVGITSSGQGISLTAARRVVFAELHWVPGRLLQAEDRVCRPGQEAEVEVHYCVVEGKPYMDGAIMRSLCDKQQVADKIVEGAEEENRFNSSRGSGV